MHHLSFLLFTLCLVTFAKAQKADLSAFHPLIGKTWKAETTWDNGSPFKQEVTFRYGLDSTVIIAESDGFVNTSFTEFGWRNHGIRKINPQTGKMEFWEFDASGGLTQGNIINFDQLSILYQYKYGETTITDAWVYENDSTYLFKVGIWENGQWQQSFLETEFRANPQTPQLDRLIGNWTSKAWDGELRESWQRGKDGHWHQKAQYVEGEKVLYEAHSKIEQVGEDWVLFTVIKDGNPKIFKATSWSNKQIIFENAIST